MGYLYVGLLRGFTLMVPTYGTTLMLSLLILSRHVGRKKHRAMDMFVVQTILFRLVYRLLIMKHGRRQILWFGFTARLTAEWIATQITEAYS